MNLGHAKNTAVNRESVSSTRKAANECGSRQANSRKERTPLEDALPATMNVVAR
jgi:hypothetical protein